MIKRFFFVTAAILAVCAGTSRSLQAQGTWSSIVNTALTQDWELTLKNPKTTVGKVNIYTIKKDGKEDHHGTLSSVPVILKKLVSGSGLGIYRMEVVPTGGALNLTIVCRKADKTSDPNAELTISKLPTGKVNLSLVNLESGKNPKVSIDPAAFNQGDAAPFLKLGL
jgi:hypothetical protein